MFSYEMKTLLSVPYIILFFDFMFVDIEFTQ